MLSRFHLVPERNGQTDGRTDRQTDRQTDRFAISISISRVSMLTRDKKWSICLSKLQLANVGAFLQTQCTVSFMT